MKKQAIYGDYTVSIATNNSVSVTYRGGYAITQKPL